MSLHNVNDAQHVGRNRVAIEGSFRPNGATGVVSGSVQGKGFTVARAGVGLYTITFDKAAYGFDGITTGIREAAGTATIVQAGDYSSTNKTVQLRVLQQGATSARTKTLPIDLLSARLLTKYVSANLLEHARVGTTAPTVDATSGGWEFDADAEFLSGSFRVPDDWDAASDMTLEMVWHSEAGDAVANTETVKWDFHYYSVAEGEAVDNGTPVVATATYTAPALQTDKEEFRTDITIDYDHANQPLTKGDTVHWTVDRDFGADSYSGDAVLVMARLVYKKSLPLIGTVDGDSSGPYIARVNGVTDPTLRLVWPVADLTHVQFAPIPWPADLNAAADVTVHLRGLMSGSTDTPTMTFTAWEDPSDTNFGGASSAFGAAIAEETLTLANANISGHPKVLNLEMVPGAHTTDSLYLYSAWLEYTSTESNGAYAAADLAADADAVVCFRALFRNSSVDA